MGNEVKLSFNRNEHGPARGRLHRNSSPKNGNLALPSYGLCRAAGPGNQPSGDYAEHCSQPLELVERTLDRDHFMTAQDALAWKLVDEVYEPRLAA